MAPKGPIFKEGFLPYLLLGEDTRMQRHDAKDRFHSLRAKLIDIIQLNVVSEEVWFPGSNAVAD